MPNMPSVGGSCGLPHEDRWCPPPHLPLCEPTQVRNLGANSGCSARRVESRTPWPFLYSYKGEDIEINRGAKKTKYQDASEVGAAMF